jgi:hypothetical protein
MNKFVFQKTFINIYIYICFNKFFYKNKESKFYYGDHTAVLNGFIIKLDGVPIIFLIALPLHENRAIIHSSIHDFYSNMIIVREKSNFRKMLSFLRKKLFKKKTDYKDNGGRVGGWRAACQHLCGSLSLLPRAHRRRPSFPCFLPSSA